LDLLCVDTNNLSARVAGRDSSYCSGERFCRGCVESIVDAIGTYIAFKLCRGKRIAVPTGRGISANELASFIETLKDRERRKQIAEHYLSLLGKCIKERCLCEESYKEGCRAAVGFAGEMYTTIYDTVLRCNNILNRVTTFNADEYRGKLEGLLSDAGDLYKDEDVQEWIEPCIAYYLRAKPPGSSETLELATLDYRAATDACATICLIIQRKIQHSSCTPQYLCELCDLGAVADLYH